MCLLRDTRPGNLELVMKNKKIMNRRDFLKAAAAFIFGTISWRYHQLINVSKPKGKTPLKEARFYTSADHLAG